MKGRRIHLCGIALKRLLYTQTNCTVGKPHWENKWPMYCTRLKGKQSCFKRREFLAIPNFDSSPRLSSHVQRKFIIIFPQAVFTPLKKITAENSKQWMLPPLPEIWFYCKWILFFLYTYLIRYYTLIRSIIV